MYYYGLLNQLTKVQRSSNKTDKTICLKGPKSTYEGMIIVKYVKACFSILNLLEMVRPNYMICHHFKQTYFQYYNRPKSSVGIDQSPVQEQTKVQCKNRPFSIWSIDKITGLKQTKIQFCTLRKKHYTDQKNYHYSSRPESNG